MVDAARDIVVPCPLTGLNRLRLGT